MGMLFVVITLRGLDVSIAERRRLWTWVVSSNVGTEPGCQDCLIRSPDYRVITLQVHHHLVLILTFSYLCNLNSKYVCAAWEESMSIHK